MHDFARRRLVGQRVNGGDAVLVKQLASFIPGEVIIAVVHTFTVWALDGTASGGVKPRNGQPQSPERGNGKLLLDQSLSERTATDDRPPVVVLDGARKNLGSRRRRLVDEYGDVPVFPTAVPACLVRAARNVFAFRVNH